MFSEKLKILFGIVIRMVSFSKKLQAFLANVTLKNSKNLFQKCLKYLNRRAQIL